jgi:molybdopterin/thiamine biosynthesis adenylyltransferase
MSIDSLFASELVPETVHAEGFPAGAHPAEADLFCRQEAMAGHSQRVLEDAHVGVIGCGGLGSWVTLALARMGVRRLTLVDPDRFDRTNAPRQLVMPADIGQFKARALAQNVAPHLTNAGSITAICRSAQDALASGEMYFSALFVGVDNNAARSFASDYARRNRIPAVFCMLSVDGLRAQVFSQLPTGPCLSCVLPNLDVASAAPCAAALIASCFLAAAHAVAMVADVVMSPGHCAFPIWRETSLDGTTERTGKPLRRHGCQCRFG